MQYSLAWAATRPEEAVDALAGVYRNIEIGTDDARRFRAATAETGDDAVVLSSSEWTAGGRGRTDANSFYLVGDVYAGSVRLSAGGERLDAGRIVLVPPVELEASWSDTHRAHTVRLDRAAVDAYVRGAIDPAAPPVAFSGTAPISPVHEALWRSVARAAREDVAAHPDLLHNDLIWDATARHLIATLLTVFPNSTEELLRQHSGAPALPASVRRAIAFMEEHLAEPVTIGEVAEAARLSPRGLQDAFHRLLGHSPLQHLRLLRLEAARDELLAADPTAGATVSAIAERWGFRHAPRFARSYREQFGENPRDTLHR
jgi:AraC-like DNA-binding protein